MVFTQDEEGVEVEDKAVLVSEEKLFYPASEGRPKPMPSQKTAYLRHTALGTSTCTCTPYFT